MKQPKLHVFTREDLFEQLMTCYEQTDICQEYPLSIKFKGEEAVDLGGVTREMFSCFWEIVYLRFFDGTQLLSPSIHVGINMEILPRLGNILSHGYLVSGFLPVQIVFPVLASTLTGTYEEFPDKYLLEAFIEFITPHEATAIKQALHFSSANYPSTISTSLATILSRYGCREVPTPDKLKQTLVELGQYQFLVKPLAVITKINSGIPSAHVKFWKSKALEELHQLYRALGAKAEAILEALSSNEPVFYNECEQRVYGYLYQYISCMSAEELRRFLRFVTGSSALTGEGLNITFNSLQGISRRPIAHTCSNTLELPTSYSTYLDFVNEFRAILLSNDDLTWIMDSV